jgi:hypothetical protein
MSLVSLAVRAAGNGHATSEGVPHVTPSDHTPTTSTHKVTSQCASCLTSCSHHNHHHTTRVPASSTLSRPNCAQQFAISSPSTVGSFYTVRPLTLRNRLVLVIACIGCYFPLRAGLCRGGPGVADLTMAPRRVRGKCVLLACAAISMMLLLVGASAARLRSRIRVGAGHDLALAHGTALATWQVPDAFETMARAAAHMVGDNLQSPEAAADLSDTVLSEKFRARFRPTLHCPVSPHGDWKRAQQAGMDILLSGDTEYSTACLWDAFRIYFDSMRKSQAAVWQKEAEQQAQQTVRQWDNFAKRVAELHDKGARLAGTPGGPSEAEAKHDQLELFHKMRHAARAQQRVVVDDARRRSATVSSRSAVGGSVGGGGGAGDSGGGDGRRSVVGTPWPSTAASDSSGERTLRELRMEQESKAATRHAAFEAFKATTRARHNPPPTAQREQAEKPPPPPPLPPPPPSPPPRPPPPPPPSVGAGSREGDGLASSVVALPAASVAPAAPAAPGGGPTASSVLSPPPTTHSTLLLPSLSGAVLPGDELSIEDKFEMLRQVSPTDSANTSVSTA